MHFHNDYVYSFGFAFKSEEKVMTKRIVAIGLLLIIVISVDLNAEEPGRVEGQTGGIVAV